MVNVEGPELVYATRFMGKEPPRELDTNAEPEDRTVTPQVQTWIRKSLGE